MSGHASGGTCVADASGAARIVYHGTMMDFEVFETGHDGTHEGAAFFTEDPAIAMQFAVTAWESAGDDDSKPWLMSCQLRVTNPLVVDASEGMEGTLHNFAAMRALVQRARDAGHDGLHLLSVPEFEGLPRADQWAVFDPDQIVLVKREIVPGFVDAAAPAPRGP